MDRTAKLWHIEYTHPLRVYAGHEQDVDVVKFHPNCNYVATGGSDKTIRLWSHSDAKMVSFEFGAEGGLILNSRQGHLIKVTKVSNFGIISLKLVFRIHIIYD